MELVFAGAVGLLLVGAAFKWMLPKKLRIVQWAGGERWIRFYPNPGFRLTNQVQWSKFRGWGRK